MAQSTTTLTPDGPTPPTNYSCVGMRPPTTAGLAQVDDGAPGTLTSFAAVLSVTGHEGGSGE
jgi:hypothetical protein